MDTFLKKNRFPTFLFVLQQLVQKAVNTNCLFLPKTKLIISYNRFNLVSFLLSPVCICFRKNLFKNHYTSVDVTHTLGQKSRAVLDLSLEEDAEMQVEREEASCFYG